MLYETAARAEEILMLDITDLDTVNRCATVVRKGGARDETLVSFDNRQLIEFTRAAHCRDTLHYEHRSTKTELLLGIPDAIAWCWAKGSPWRQQIDLAVARVVDV
jgi:integrase